MDNYVRSCKVCLKVNVARPHTKEPLQKLRPPALQVGDRIHIDLVDMPKATSGHVAICTLVDSATGFTILQPVLDKTSQSVSSTLLNHYIPYFGVPKVLVTDKGKENANSEIKKMTERYNIQHIFSSTSHPQSNGMVERRQQMITQILKKTIADISEQKNWPSKMPELQTIINSTTFSSRGFSPFVLTFLKHPNFPFQQLLTASPNYSDQSNLTVRFNLSNRLIKECEKTLEESFEKAKEAFDSNAKPNKLSPGDIVYVKTTQRGLLHHKFADRSKGPYKIISFLDNNNVQLTPLGSGRSITTHVNNCKKAIVGFPHLELPQETLPPNVHSKENNHAKYWDYVPPSELLDDHETSTAVPSTEDDPPNPIAPPGEDNLSDDATDQQQPEASASSRVTRATADPSKLTPYVYDTLPLEKRLSKIIEEKRKKKVEEERRKRLKALGLAYNTEPKEE